MPPSTSESQVGETPVSTTTTAATTKARKVSSLIQAFEARSSLASTRPQPPPAPSLNSNSNSNSRRSETGVQGLSSSNGGGGGGGSSRRMVSAPAGRGGEDATREKGSRLAVVEGDLGRMGWGSRGDVGVGLGDGLATDVGRSAGREVVPGRTVDRKEVKKVLLPRRTTPAPPPPPPPSSSSTSTSNARNVHPATPSRSFTDPINGQTIRSAVPSPSPTADIIPLRSVLPTSLQPPTRDRTSSRTKTTGLNKVGDNSSAEDAPEAKDKGRSSVTRPSQEMGRTAPAPPADNRGETVTRGQVSNSFRDTSNKAMERKVQVDPPSAPKEVSPKALHPVPTEPSRSSRPTRPVSDVPTLRSASLPDPPPPTASADLPKTPLRTADQASTPARERQIYFADPFASRKDRGIGSDAGDISLSTTSTTLVGSSSPPSPRRPLLRTRTSSAGSKSQPFPSRPRLPNRLPTSSSFGGLSSMTAQTRDVPASQVFSSSAPPLHLPALDACLAAIPNFEFSRPGEVMSKDEKKDWDEWCRGGSGVSVEGGGGKGGGIWERVKKALGVEGEEIDWEIEAERYEEEVRRKRMRWTEEAKSGTVNMCEKAEASTIDMPILLSSPSSSSSREKRPSSISKLLTKPSPPVLKKPLSANAARALIFPPMHLLPNKLTVTDLKLNRSSSPPLLTLDSLLGTVIDAVLGAEGSSYAAALIRVEIFRDAIQMMGLALGFAVRPPEGSVGSGKLLIWNDGSTKDWKTIVFYTVPSILGLDFVSAFGMAIVWFWVFLAIVGLATWEFWKMTGGWKGPNAFNFGSSGKKESEDEGFDAEGELFDRVGVGGEKVARVDAKKNGKGKAWRESRWFKICVVFLITSFYVPLSKISISALVWSSDFWVVPDPYTTEDYPTLPSLGPSSEFRDPLDFCYTTNMRVQTGFQNFNFAWFILPIAGFSVIWLTVWFPLRLYYVIEKTVPRVDPWTELGEKRKDVDAEYERILEVDEHPFNFLYINYRRKWSGFKAIYMGVKLANVLCITIFSKDNCLFRNAQRDKVNVVRQGIQLGLMSVFLVLQCLAHPYIDRISNNSDWVSRIGYVAVAFLGLLVALNVPGQAALAGWVVLLVTVIVYVLNGYFALIGTGIAQRWVKRFQCRLDFSIDLFSPHLDLAKHVARRIWQETLSTLMLAAREYKMEKGHHIVFVESEKTAPYLLGFQGSQGERHILREIGLEGYGRALQDLDDLSLARLHQMRRDVLKDFTGPDCFWRPKNPPPNVTSFFGRVHVVPFPFAIVMRYDQGSQTVTFSSEEDLAEYIAQNTSDEVRASRRIRRVFRAMDGQTIFAPRVEERLLAEQKNRWSRRTSAYAMQIAVVYRMGVLRIERNSDTAWRGYNYNSGFEVSIHYNDGQTRRPDGTAEYGKELTLPASALGLSDDFRVTPALARLFKDNRHVIEANLQEVESALARHRDYFREEIEWKEHVLSYGFLLKVAAEDKLTKDQLAKLLLRTESSPRVRALPALHCGAIDLLEERMDAVTRSRISQWWFICFDDLWRRNFATVAELRKYEVDFSPHYRVSICYRPMPRKHLENFLRDRGLWRDEGRRGFFNSGFLNRLFFYLDEIVFNGTSKAIPILVTDTSSDPDRSKEDINFDNLDQVADNSLTFSTVSRLTYDTGGGTDHDDPMIRPRHAFTFEELYDPPEVGGFGMKRLGQVTRNVGVWLKTWLGLTPYPHHRRPPGIYFSLREDGSGKDYRLPRTGS